MSTINVIDGSVEREKTVNAPSDPYQNLENISTPTVEASKRLFFNGSSYSGVDIKVYVHKYSNDTEALSSNLEAAAAAYSQVVTKLQSIKANLPDIVTQNEQYKLGLMTQAEYDQQFRRLYTNIGDEIAQLEQNLPGITYNQFIAVNFVYPNRTRAQSSQDGFLSSEIDTIVDVLQTLQIDWLATAQDINQYGNQSGLVQTKVLSELQTISLSSFRDKQQVRACGTVYPKGFTRGPRTVAGSMIFTVFDRNVLFSLLTAQEADVDMNRPFSPAVLDQMPPLDLTILFANEYGSLSRMSIYGVEFISEGQSMSIEDMFLENQVQYVARDWDPMTPILRDGRSFAQDMWAFNRSLEANRRPEGQPVTASQLMRSQVKYRTADIIGTGYLQEEEETIQKTRHRNRYNPFI